MVAANRYPKDVELKCFFIIKLLLLYQVLQVLVSSNALQLVLDNLLDILPDKMQDKHHEMMRRDDELERMKR